MSNSSHITVKKVAHFKGHKDAVYSFQVGGTKQKIYSVGADGYVVEWDVNRPENGNLILRSGEAFYGVGWMNNLLQVGSRNGEVFSVDVEQQKLLKRTKVHDGGIFTLSNGITGGEDGRLKGPEIDIRVSEKSLRCMVEGDQHLFIGSSDHMIYQLDRQSFEVQNVFKGHTNSVFSLALLNDKTLVSTGRDASIKVWDLTIGKEVYSVPAHDYQAKSLSWNGRLLLSSSMDKTIKLWNEKLELLKVIDKERNDGHTNCINKVEWIDENMFVSCSDDRSLILWKVEILS